MKKIVKWWNSPITWKAYVKLAAVCTTLAYMTMFLVIFWDRITDGFYTIAHKIKRLFRRV